MTVDMLWSVAQEKASFLLQIYVTRQTGLIGGFLPSNELCNFYSSEIKDLLLSGKLGLDYLNLNQFLLPETFTPKGRDRTFPT